LLLLLFHFLGLSQQLLFLVYLFLYVLLGQKLIKWLITIHFLNHIRNHIYVFNLI